MQDIETAVDGLVEAVPVKEGVSVEVGDLLVRFDRRDAETRLQAFRRKRVPQSQIAINRVVLGEQTKRSSPTNNSSWRQRRKYNGNVAAREALDRTPSLACVNAKPLRTSRCASMAAPNAIVKCRH